MVARFVYLIYRAIDCGDLPVGKINGVLGTELLPGRAVLSAIAPRHIALDHTQDYQLCVQSLALAITAPSLIGKAPRHGNDFEMVRRLLRDDRRDLLVAIELLPNARGNYRIVSAYPVLRSKIERMRLAGYLRPCP